MMKEKIFWFIGLLFILTFWLTETVESKVYSPGPGINGPENSNNNSGSTTRHNGGNSRYGESAGRPRLSKPDFDNKGNGHGRSKRKQKKKKKKNRKQSGNKKSKKRSGTLPVSSSGGSALKVSKKKK
ncbi:hypothetical protein QUF70_19115, partial [Desulfobacterales bacterium HSG17]|nr:hypothetical protein [Desulfobacterales bacterium HSG17]